MTHLTSLPPFEPSYGYGKRMMYRTTSIAALSGLTEENAHWNYPLHMFTLPLTNRLQNELEQIRRYFHAAKAQANSFNFLDRTEDRTCPLADDPDDEDVTLGTATASQTDFQLKLVYSDGGVDQERKITRPIESTVVVAVDGTPSVAWTIQAGGILRFDTGLTGGEVVTWGGRFYVPVKFAADDVDVTIHNWSGSEFVGDSSVNLREIRE